MLSLFLFSDVGCVSLCRQGEGHFGKNLGFGNKLEFKFSLLYTLVVWPDLGLDPIGRAEWMCRE